MTDSVGAHDDVAGLPIDVLRSMLGRRIVRVGYKSSTDSLQGVDQGDRVLAHEAEHAVVVSTDSKTVALEWCIRNYDEFLNIANSPDEGVASAVSHVLDVTGQPPWQIPAGSVIANFGVATQRSEDGHESLWSVRFGFENGASVVVALGEMRGSVPSYQPDSLVVIFEPKMAQSYQILDSSESAWGRDLHL